MFEIIKSTILCRVRGKEREGEGGGGEEGKKSKYREKGNESPRPGKFTKEFIFTYLIEMVAGHFDEKKKG